MQENEETPPDVKELLAKAKDLKSISVKVETKAQGKGGQTGYIVLTFGSTPGHRAPVPGDASQLEKIAAIAYQLDKNPGFTVVPGDVHIPGIEVQKGDTVIAIAPKGRNLKDTQNMVVGALRKLGASLDTSTGAAAILDAMHRRPGALGRG